MPKPITHIVVLRIYAEILARIRNWLISKLPQRERDEQLGVYGYDPRDEALYIVPAPITGFAAAWSAENSRIELKWNLCENATEYEIFSAFEPEDANADPNFKRLAKTEHLYYYITNAEAGKTYLFKVRGITHYRQGEFSNTIEVMVP